MPRRKPADVKLAEISRAAAKKSESRQEKPSGSPSEDAFRAACDIVLDSELAGGGIGTLGEKTVHAVLKHYLSPDVSCHEQKVSSYVADILTEGNIIEVQTRNFNSMRSKLSAFLPEHHVTVVYPVAQEKWLRWIDPDSGEISKPRKSPKYSMGYGIFVELYRIKNYLLDPNLDFHIVFLQLEEYRYLDGWNATKKKGSSRSDGIPVRINEEFSLKTPKDYLRFLPATLPEHFTSADLQKAAKISRPLSNVALNILHYLGVVAREGKKGNFYIYSIDLKE